MPAGSVPIVAKNFRAWRIFRTNQRNIVAALALPLAQGYDEAFSLGSL